MGLCAVVCALAMASAGRAETSGGVGTSTGDKLDVATYLEYETVANPQLSPDGTQVLYTRRIVNKLADEWDPSMWYDWRNDSLSNGVLYILDVADGSVSVLTSKWPERCKMIVARSPGQTPPPVAGSNRNSASASGAKIRKRMADLRCPVGAARILEPLLYASPPPDDGFFRRCSGSDG
jgi:hypothetical protein